MKVLVIEDDIELNTTICQFLGLKSFETLSAKDGLMAISMIDDKDVDVDLYIIDINLPEINGLDLVSYIRKTDLVTPIVIITASLEVQNFSMAFENGCSEYIKKPFHLKELDIRIKNLLSIKEDNLVRLEDGLDYNLSEEEFLYKNKPIELRNKEKRLCALMIKNINQIVSNEAIYDYVWEGEIRESYPLRQLLVNLRKKLPYDLIQNRTRKGYFISSSKNVRAYRVSWSNCHIQKTLIIAF